VEHNFEGYLNGTTVAAYYHIYEYTTLVFMLPTLGENERVSSAFLYLHDAYPLPPEPQYFRTDGLSQSS